jgi:hypothetical protein
MSSHDATEHQDSNRQHISLDRRYGKIGISAVAAAVRWRGSRTMSETHSRYAQERD